MLAEDAGASTALGAALLEQLERTCGAGILLRKKQETLRELCSLFIQSYGDGPVSVLRAPARINVLGEHIDYVSYLPTSSITFGSREHEMILLFRPSEDCTVRGRSTLGDCEPFSFDLDEEPLESTGETAAVWERHLFSRPAPAPHWKNYVRGAVFFMRMKYGARVRRGFDFVIDSSVPPAGGASSSSALTVLAGAALLHANHLPFTPHELAFDSSKAEWYVGTRGGAMDHLTICLSRAASAVHISYSDGICRQLPLPGTPYCWLTFFSHAADKSREIMLEYNERAAISRIWIPALLEDWAASNRDLYQSWQAGRKALEVNHSSAFNDLEPLLGRLPETIVLVEAARRYPEAMDACRRAFPSLIRERLERPLRLRDRARHHIGEVRRVAEAGRVLQSCASGASGVDPAMRRIGELLNASHSSLRDFYDLCTPEVETLRDAVMEDGGVYGARLMGGGFGGNVLALTTENHAPSLVARLRRQFYEPRGRHVDRECSIMISTPGAGLSALGVEAAVREQILRFNRRWDKADHALAHMRNLLGQLPADQGTEVRLIIVAAGEGKRARSSGLAVPKPLAEVLGVPATVRVLRAVKQACSPAQPIIVVVSPETEALLRMSLERENISWVLQPQALGTGDAVFRAREMMRNFDGRALVVWGTQPVLRPETVSLSLRLAELFPEYSMVLPTALIRRPYAPVLRDAEGRVCSAVETHLEQREPPELGESNIGMFLLWSQTMFRMLEELRRQLWQEAAGCYDRPGGELGFPNEFIRRLAGRPGGVLASPIADWREEKGIKVLEDVALCERYVRELAGSVT